MTENRISETDRKFIRRAVEVALKSEQDGNLPIGAVIVMNDEVVAEGYNAVRSPHYHPGRHAEMEALRNVPAELWPESRKFTCYTTLEPCIMCFGSLILHGPGRVVFGARDPKGGAGYLLSHLPEYYDKKARPEWVGPVMPETCDSLYQRAARMFEQLGKEP